MKKEIYFQRPFDCDNERYKGEFLIVYKTLRPPISQRKQSPSLGYYNIMV